MKARSHSLMTGAQLSEEIYSGFTAIAVRK